MSVFDEAKNKAEDLIGQAKEKFGQNQDNQNQDENQREGIPDQLRDKASDAMHNAKDRFNS